MKLQYLLLRTLGTWTVLLAFLVLFRPDKLPLPLLIMPFILLFAALYSSWGLLMVLWGRYFSSNGVVKPLKRLGATVSMSVVLLLVLQSLGQLTARDVLTVVAIVTLGYLYIGRSRIRTPKRQ